MFRRRPIFGPSGRSPINDIPPALRRANELSQIGDYASAALIFEDFSRRAVTRNGPRAPWFLIQAGRMRILAGEVPLGMEHLLQALHLFAGRGQWNRLSNSGHRLVEELKQRGLVEESGKIEAMLRSNLPTGFVASSGIGTGSIRQILPTNCPKCGAPLHTDEIEWTDEITAECPYCGNAIRIE
jgi:hypothetical protein